MIKNFIDAGHGGKDSGAIGLNNIYESHIVLDICRKIDAYLKPSKIENHMSRSTDIYLTLSERTNKSNKLYANTQVSVHCNSATNPDGKGLEIFYMSSNGKKLASCILDELKKDGLYTKLRDGGLKTANHHMNREAKATSCLIELGFITNVQDYKLITENKDRFAKAIANGICKYHGISFNDKSPSTSQSKPLIKYKNGDYNSKARTTANLNIRTERNTSSKIIKTLPKGTILEVNYCLDNWFSTYDYKYNNKPCYVFGDYIELI